ncbi:MAG: hypothetical protein R6W78_01140 [Bacteroidales bacterium]
MRTIIFILSFITLLSCDKKDDTNNLEQNPKWLVDLISTIDNNPQFNKDTIYRHTWKNQFYYHYFGYYSSCVYCKVYNYDGNIVNWENENFDDYLLNRNNEIIIWKYIK